MFVILDSGEVGRRLVFHQPLRLISEERPQDVPGALQAAQVGKLVAQLFEHEKQQNPDADELEMATERFMAAQVEEPTPTRSGLKPMPLAASQVQPRAGVRKILMQARTSSLELHTLAHFPL
jgi:preprotein translocase subunit SecD